MAVAYIGIGSNVGERIDNCAQAVRQISNFANIVSVSSLYETEPVDKEDQPDFINCAVKIETALYPLDLLESIQSVEDRMGRRREERWGPRVIDLDIIFYDNLVIETEKLTIPHPRAHLRRFVLLPISEIDPELLHPVLGVSVSQLLNWLNDEKQAVKVGDFKTLYPHKFTICPHI